MTALPPPDLAAQLLALQEQLTALTDRHRLLEAEHRLIAEKLKQRDRDFAKVLTFSSQLTKAIDIPTLYRQIALAGQELLAFDYSTLMLLSADHHSLSIADTVGFPATMIGTFSLVQGHGLSTYVVQNKQPAQVTDFTREDRFEVPPIVRAEGIRSALCVPMMLGSEIFGVLIGHCRALTPFAADAIALYQSFANQAAVAIKNAQHFQALREQEELLRTILETIPNPLFYKNRDGRYLGCNSAFAQALGLRKEQIVNATVADLTPPEVVAIHQQTDQELLRQPGKRTYETILHYADGTAHDLLVFKASYGSPEQPVQGVVGTMIDITSRKQAEAALVAEKEQLAVTLRSIGDGVITADTNGNVVLLNRVAETLTGWQQADAAGRPLPEVFRIIDEHTRETRPNPVSKVLASGRIITLANHTLLIAKDGSERSIADSAAPIFGNTSLLLGAVLVFRDVTDQKVREAELVKMEKLESVGLLAGGIAHDFNNILAAILGSVNVAGHLVPPDHEAHPLLLQAQKAALRAKELTQQLLTFAKGGEPVKVTAAIAEVIRDSANFILHGTNIAFCDQLSPDLWLVSIDKGQISQVIQNITLNARQAMPSGGTITVGGRNLATPPPHILLPAPGKYIEITIRDTGPGIPEPIRKRIFDPYFSTKSEGSGLGLAITHAIIEKHGGSISVESTVGCGTLFTIYLPAPKAEAPPLPPPAAETLRAGKGKLLLMDDDPMVQQVTQSMLAFLGYEVEAAADGQEAFALYRQALATPHPYGAVIMDLTIPGGMGGREAAVAILALDPLAKLIVASGYSSDPVMANFAEFGFQAALCKPFQLAELSAILQRLLAPEPKH